MPVLFKATGPIGDTDTNAIPVREIGPAVGYYTQCLGFSLVSKDKTTARLKRDDVEIGLAVNGQDPEQASCWFSVGDVDALWGELDAKKAEPGVIDEQEYDGHASVHDEATAARLGLLATGSSDFHGAGKQNRLAESTTPDEVVAELLARAASGTGARP